MKKAISAVLGALTLFSCASAGSDAPVVCDRNGNRVKGELVKVLPAKSLKVWELKLRQGREVKPLRLYQYGDWYFVVPPFVLKGCKFAPVPGEEVEREKILPLTQEELSALRKTLSEVERDGVNFGVSVEKARYAVFFSPFCPFCKEAFLTGKAERLKGRAAFVPVSVHGELESVAAAYLLQQAKKRPMPEVALEWFKKLDGCDRRCLEKIADLVSKRELYLEQRLTDAFRKFSLPGVPLVVDLKSGRVYFGMKEAEEVLNAE